MLEGLTNSDGIPALERLMQFTSARHRVIVNNIANLSTPGFRPQDVSPEAFQAQLRDAIDASRAGAGNNAALAENAARQDFRQDPFDESCDDLADGVLGVDGPSAGGAHSALPLQSSREVEVLPDRVVLHPEAAGDNILFHDGNDRSVERVMQGLVENFMAYRASAQLLRSRLDIIRSAIRERV